MNSTKSKKKSKAAKIPKPIKIKKEDDHIMYPMEHYVDDRVELIRQIFSSLKPKTITNLAPEFLKKFKLEDIQEQCLNEILGISKKRLLAVINSTKCPTDTETSSEDDVNSVEEHISLEEISSDSDIVEPKGKKKQKIKGDTDSGSNKQFSVLELLELQARARAIRSQLALEPVTKIEVDTESDEEEAASIKPPPSSRKKSDKKINGGPTDRKSDTTKRPASATVTNTKTNGEPAPSASIKRIKLKRNFRKKTLDDDDGNDAVNRSEKSSNTIGIETKTESRSPSPDVIPIISVPETLCISDSDDEKIVQKEPIKDTATFKPSECTKSVQILSVVNIEAVQKQENTTESADTSNKPIDPPKEPSPVETEEGEILEDEEETRKADFPKPNEAVARKKAEPESTVEDSKETSQEQKITKADVEDSNETKQATKVPKAKIEFGEEDSKETIRLDDVTPVNVEQTTGTSNEIKEIPETSVKQSQSVESSESEDDTNDDVISLEGGDLLNEMKEHLEDEVEETTQVNEVICLDDSSEEETKDKKKTESWNERWLKSSKVSKVLAASRLGNRVRNKIKETKKAKKLKDAAVTEAEHAKPQVVIFTSRHEDGSMDQYKELLEKIKRKTD